MEVETDAEYFDYLAGLPNTHRYRVLSIWNFLLYKPNSWEKSKKGASALFLVVLRGNAKGGNRNPPFAILSFDRQRRFLSHAEKESGVETFPRVLRTQFFRACGAVLRPPGANRVSPLRGVAIIQILYTSP